MSEGDSPPSAVVRIASDENADELLEAAQSDERVRVVATGSTGLPALEPLVVATAGGRTRFYAAASADRIEGIVGGLAEGDPPDADFEVEGGDDGAIPTPDAGPLAVGTRRVLAGCGWRDPTDPADYEAAGGFVGSDADATTAREAASGIDGRGWGDGARDAPVESLWTAVAEADAAEAPVVVVNAHGTEADRLLLAGDPFAVLDGALLAAAAVDATEIHVFVSEDHERAVERAETAAEAVPADVPIDVTAGPATYKAAEPTMAIEALEGNHRLEARLRPPGPEEVGLYGRPTLVHTARTLAHVAAAARGEGVDSRIVTVEGDVEAPATVELPTDDTVATALDATAVDGTFKAACVGGRFGGVTDTLDVGVGADALAAADLGTGGVVDVLNDERCTVTFVGKRTQWAAETNCGRCVPCREGSTQLAGLLRDVYDGRYDPDAVDELARVVGGTSICAFGRDLPRPIRTAMDAFADEFDAHAAGACPAGVCTDRMEVTH